jgi:hypothetical protein
LVQLDGDAALNANVSRVLKDAIARMKCGDAMLQWGFESMGKVAWPLLVEISRMRGNSARLPVVWLLSLLGGQDAGPLVAELVEDADDETAFSAIQQAGHFKLKQAVPALLRRVLNYSADIEEHDDGRGVSARQLASSAAQSLVEIGDVSIRGQLVEATRHRMPVIRMCAIDILGRLCGPEAVPELGKLLDDVGRAAFTIYPHDSNVQGPFTVHEIAALALDKIGTDEAITLLRDYRKRYPWFEGARRLSIDDETPVKDAAAKRGRKRNQPKK